jgi:hypothetical protein
MRLRRVRAGCRDGTVAIAGAHNLVVTGGSDFHGPGLGAGSGAIGVPHVPETVLEELAQRRG